MNPAILQAFPQLTSPYIFSATDILLVGFAISIYVYFDRKVGRMKKEFDDFKDFYEHAHADLRERLARIEQGQTDILTFIKKNGNSKDKSS